MEQLSNIIQSSISGALALQANSESHTPQKPCRLDPPSPWTVVKADGHFSQMNGSSLRGKQSFQITHHQNYDNAAQKISGQRSLIFWDPPLMTWMRQS